jgi:nucleoid DNA-binding protein
MRFQQVDGDVLEQFTEARLRYEDVHDRDLQEWGLVAAQRHNLPAFKASEKWLYNFKGRHKIVGRKITKFITHSSHADRQKVQEAIHRFMENIAPILADTDPSRVNSFGTSNAQQRALGRQHRPRRHQP